jgi:hypothetical protein
MLYRAMQLLWPARPCRQVLTQATACQLQSNHGYPNLTKVPLGQTADVRSPARPMNRDRMHSTAGGGCRSNALYCSSTSATLVLAWRRWATMCH